MRGARNAIKTIRNQIGSARGFSGCYHCGDSWSWKESVIIWYSPNKGMSHICIECFSILTPKQILTYCHELFWNWKRSGYEETWLSIIDNIRASIYHLKEKSNKETKNGK